MSDQTAISFDELKNRLQNGEALENCIIEDVDFYEFREIDDFTAKDIRFQSCEFGKTKLVGAFFERCQFHDCRFTSADLTDTRFEQCNLFSAKFASGTNLNYTQLREARFEGCNLSASTFIGASLFDVAIKDCKANGVSFRDAQFSYSYASGTPVVRASIVNSIFDDANLAGINLEGATLERSTFVHADLSNCIFAGADMTRCDLGQARFNRANFDQTDLRGARLEGMSIGLLSGYDRMRISADQQAEILSHLGIAVFD